MTCSWTCETNPTIGTGRVAGSALNCTNPIHYGQLAGIEIQNDGSGFGFRHGCQPVRQIARHHGYTKSFGCFTNFCQKEEILH